MPLRFHDRMRSGERVSRLTTDVGRVQVGDTAAVSETVNYDDVVMDPSHIG